MVNFIRLTEVMSRDKKEVSVLVNASCIETVRLGIRGEDTVLILKGLSDEGKSRYMFVKETVNQIQALLYPVPVML